MTSGSDRPARRLLRQRSLILVWGSTLLVILATVTFAVIRSGPLSPGSDFLMGAAFREDSAETKDEPEADGTPGNAADLATRIQRILDANHRYRIGVALVDTHGGEPQTYGDVSPYLAASTAKVLTAVSYYHLVELGEATLDEPLGDFTAAFQLKAMINTSSDDSWLLLMDAVGYPRIIEYAASIGITYDPERNLLTPPEMANLLKQLYSGALLNAENTKELLGYMQETNNEKLIPAAVPPGITVRHKYGVVEGYIHDAAVLSSGDNAYSLAIYTWSPDGTGAQERTDAIHELTSEIIAATFGAQPPSR